jgi:hypothetical protein
MGPVVEVIVCPLVFLVIFMSLGAAPVAVLGKGLRAQSALAPVAGVAIAAILLTDASPLVPARVSAWALLLPAAAGSLAVALILERRWIGRVARAAVEIVALAMAGAFIALVPVLRERTVGPLAFHIYDVLQYISVDDWLQRHSTSAALSRASQSQLSVVYGHASIAHGVRIGVDSINAAVPSLLGLSPSQTASGFIAALFGLGAASAWFTARAVGLTFIGAITCTLFTWSAGFLVLVFDTAIGNLAGLVVAGPLLACIYVGLVKRSPRILVLGGILIAGLIAVYPEFIVPSALAAGVLVIGYAVNGVSNGTRPAAVARESVAGVGILLVVPLLVAPVALSRAVEYLHGIANSRQEVMGVPRTIGAETFLPWLFGVVHVYELDAFQAMSNPGRVLRLGLVGGMVLAILAPSWRTRRFWVFLVGVPVLIGFALGVAGKGLYSGGNCGYCEWKSWTFMLPFVGLGLGIAASSGETLVRAQLARSRRARRLHLPSNWLATVCVIGVLAIPAAAIARADSRLIRAQGSAVMPTTLRTIATRAAHAPGRNGGILLEGSDAVPSPGFIVPATYEALTESGVRRILLDTQVAKTVQYLGLGAAAPDVYYRPDYKLVISPYAGLDSGRTTLSREGNYVLQERAPIDVDVGGALVDTGEGRAAIPWIVGPLQLWISSPARKRGSLVVRFVVPSGQFSAPAILVDGRRLDAVKIGDDTVCVDMGFSRGRTTVDVRPGFAPLPTYPTFPKELGVSSVRASTDPCPSVGDAGHSGRSG